MALFNKKTAIIAAKLSHAPGSARFFTPKIEPIVIIAPQPAIEPADIYTTGRIVRVRQHIERLDELLLAESDPQKIDRLAAAFAKLSEVERQLSGRPLPGSLRAGRQQLAPPRHISDPEAPSTAETQS